MIRYKDTVDLRIIKPQTVFAIFIADQVYGNMGFTEMWITSICDDTVGRKPNSLHRSGLAFDLRLPFPPTSAIGTTAMQHNPKVVQLEKGLKLRLGPSFDVVLESDHIHVEYDVKPFAPDLQKS